MPGDDLLQTPLHAWHRSHGARLVEFAGWSMPVQYTSIVEEHRTVRRQVGLFDISHMGRLFFEGPRASEWLERVTTNQVSRLREGQVQYSLVANDRGGLIDDVLIDRLPTGFVMVCNASNRTNVLAQLEPFRPDGESLIDRTTETAMIAVQGPEALATVQPLFDGRLEPLRYYHLARGRLIGSVDAIVSRTGYTGEDGFELIVDASKAEAVWTALLESGAALGIKPCGLGARDTLRFEAGMPLYGHELSEDVNPYAAGLGWAVKLDKGEFVGREALRLMSEDPGRTRIGLRLEGKRAARQGSRVLQRGREIGIATSGTYAPSLEQSLAMALVDVGATGPGEELEVDVRGHLEKARVTELPFYRRPASRRSSA